MPTCRRRQPRTRRAPSLARQRAGGVRHHPAVILFAAYQAFSYFFAPRPTFVPNFDPGDSKVAAGSPLSIDLQMDVDPNIRDGDVRVDTDGKSLIKAKRIEP